MIHLPEEMLGKPIKGSLEKVLAKSDEPTIAPSSESSAPHLSGYIYLPSLNIYLAKERTLLGKSWYQCHEALHTQNLRMPTIPEFIAFINYLKNNSHGTADASASEIQNIVDDIVTMRDPWRAEWLDADFKVVKKELYIHYNHQTIHGELKSHNTELLTDYLTTNKTPGIDINDWLHNANQHGLPKPTVKEGTLYYWAPMKDNKSVARFYALSDWAGLVCCRDPDNSSDSLGVRCVCEANAVRAGGAPQKI